MNVNILRPVQACSLQRPFVPDLWFRQERTLQPGCLIIQKILYGFYKSNTHKRPNLFAGKGKDRRPGGLCGQSFGERVQHPASQAGLSRRPTGLQRVKGSRGKNHPGKTKNPGLEGQATKISPEPLDASTPLETTRMCRPDRSITPGCPGSIFTATFFQAGL